jgi:YD repeat-containing protein
VSSGTAAAAETTSFTYDALGRLVAVTTSTGPNQGLNVRTCYDRAGNRSTHTVATSGSQAPCPPPPPGPPPPPPPGGSAARAAGSVADA